MDYRPKETEFKVPKLPKKKVVKSKVKADTAPESDCDS